VGILLERINDSATSTCAKAFITYIRLNVSASNVLAVDGRCVWDRKVTVSASNVLAADVFGTGIFH
jgi:hypothetical protein